MFRNNENYFHSDQRVIYSCGCRKREVQTCRRLCTQAPKSRREKYPRYNIIDWFRRQLSGNDCFTAHFVLPLKAIFNFYSELLALTSNHTLFVRKNRPKELKGEEKLSKDLKKEVSKLLKAASTSCSFTAKHKLFAFVINGNVSCP